MDLIDSLVSYVNEIKPYHTKIYGVNVEYRAIEDINITFNEQLSIECWLGVPFRNLENFNWTLEQLVIPDDVVDFEAFYDTHGSGLMSENLIVGFDESISFAITKLTTDNPNIVDTAIGDYWDPDIDGIEVLDYTPTSIAVWGDVVNIINQLSTFDITGSDFNDGSYNIISATYDSVAHRTIILVMVGPDPSGSGGRIQISTWDAIEWDGNSINDTDRPIADLSAETAFVEQFIMVENYGWDDPLAGGWDNNDSFFTWDDAVLWINGVKSTEPSGAVASPPIPDPIGSIIPGQTSDQYWSNYQYSAGNVEYRWNDIQMLWEHPSINTQLVFSLQPNKFGIPGDWVSGLRASVLQLNVNSGPDEQNNGFLFGDIVLYDTDDNVVGSQSYIFTDYDEDLVISMTITNSFNLNYARLEFQTYLYNTGPLITLLEFDP